MSRFQLFGLICHLLLSAVRSAVCPLLNLIQDNIDLGPFPPAYITAGYGTLAFGSQDRILWMSKTNGSLQSKHLVSKGSVRDIYLLDSRVLVYSDSNSTVYLTRDFPLVNATAIFNTENKPRLGRIWDMRAKEGQIVVAGSADIESCNNGAGSLYLSENLGVSWKSILPTAACPLSVDITSPPHSAVYVIGRTQEGSAIFDHLYVGTNGTNISRVSGGSNIFGQVYSQANIVYFLNPVKQSGIEVTRDGGNTTDFIPLRQKGPYGPIAGGGRYTFVAYERKAGILASFNDGLTWDVMPFPSYLSSSALVATAYDRENDILYVLTARHSEGTGIPTYALSMSECSKQRQKIPSGAGRNEPLRAILAIMLLPAVFLFESF